MWGGKNTDDYVGVWQRDEAQFLQFIEIKKDGGNYSLTQDNKNYILSESNGELVLNTGFGSVPFQLSDDRETLFANMYSGGSNRFFKVKDENCKKLIAEFQAAVAAIPINPFNKQFKEANENANSVGEKYRSQCNKG